MLENVKQDKRERLTGAAKALFYQAGVQNTSLADIAQAAEVPLGNVYYHFKTKDALIEAVIAAHAADIHAELARYNAEAEPLVRLRAFVRRGLPYKDALTRFGCPYITLCAELSKGDARSAESAATLFNLYLGWLERQFRDLGRADAAELALETFSTLQGAFIITYVTHAPQLLEQQTARLERWISAL